MERQYYFEKYCNGKNVLNVGCCSSKPLEELRMGCWLQRNLERLATTVVGIDNNKELIVECQKFANGKLVFADAQHFDLKQQFDVIVAGELIEHLSNLDGFLGCVSKHLSYGGVFILTTANPFKLSNVLNGLLGRELPVQEDHVVYLSVEILRNLLSKYGFKIVEYSCVTERTLKQPLGNKLMRFVTGLVEGYGELINVVCVKQ